MFRCRAVRQLLRLKDFRTENGSSHGHNQAYLFQVRLTAVGLRLLSTCSEEGFLHPSRRSSVPTDRFNTPGPRRTHTTTLSLVRALCLFLGSEPVSPS